MARWGRMQWRAQAFTWCQTSSWPCGQRRSSRWRPRWFRSRLGSLDASCLLAAIVSQSTCCLFKHHLWPSLEATWFGAFKRLFLYWLDAKSPFRAFSCFCNLGCQYVVKISCFLFEFFACLFGSFLPCWLMLRAPLLFLVWFRFVPVGLVWFGLVLFCFALFVFLFFLSALFMALPFSLLRGSS